MSEPNAYCSYFHAIDMDKLYPAISDDMNSEQKPIMKSLFEFMICTAFAAFAAQLKPTMKSLFEFMIP
jgi:hypothetical protein